MAGKPLSQRIADADERIRELQARKQALVQSMQQQERKARTRRLIQVGAIMATLGMDSLEKARAFQKQVESRPEVRQWLDAVLEGSQGLPETDEGAGQDHA